MPVEIAPQHTKANPITKGLAVERAGPIFEPHETVEYRTSYHNLSCEPIHMNEPNLGTSIDRCECEPIHMDEPNLGTSMNSWKYSHTLGRTLGHS